MKKREKMKKGMGREREGKMKGREEEKEKKNCKLIKGRGKKKGKVMEDN